MANKINVEDDETNNEYTYEDDNDEIPPGRIIGVITVLIVLVCAFLTYYYVYVPKKNAAKQIQFRYAYEIGEKVRLRDVNVVVIYRHANLEDSEVQELYQVMIENTSVVINEVNEKKLTKWKP